MRGSAIALVLAVVSQRAYGGGSGIVVAADDAHGIAEAFAAAMRSNGATRVVADARSEARVALAAGAQPVTALEQFRRVRDDIDEGWRAYHSVQFEAAAARFAEARDTAAAMLQLPGASALYADASLRLGVVLAQLGRAAEARDAIAVALAFDPDRPISPLEFAPETIAVIDGVRSGAVAKRSVQIATEPEGAALSIDGREAGRAPAHIELSLGHHSVLARLPQYAPRARVFTVTETPEPISLALAPSEPVRRLAIGPAAGITDVEAQQFVDSVLLFADLDDVVVAVEGARGGDPILLAQRCAGAPAHCTAIVEVAYGERTRLGAATQALWRDLRQQNLTQPLRVFGDSRLAQPRRGRGRCTACRNPYVIAGVGAAVVAGTIAVVLAVTGSRPPPVLAVDPATFTR